MKASLPNPFEFESAPSSSRAGQLTAHVDHAAVLLSRAKATEGKAGMAGVTDTVRRSSAGTGLRVGEAVAVLPATSEVMGVTAGETALNSRSLGDGDTVGGTGNAVADAVNGAETSAMDVTTRRDEQPFFSIDLPEKPEAALIPSAEVTAELEAGIAAIVAGVARKRSHIAFRSFASNSTFIPTT